jgi:hypothetical protein
MQHNFDTGIAQKHGIEEAIIYQNIQFWCAKNRANHKNIHDGLAWTYNTHEAFQELFPYMKVNTIKRVLKNLKEAGLIDVRNDLSEDKWDKTNYYASIDINVTIDSEEKSPSMIDKNNHEYNTQIINTDNKHKGNAQALLSEYKEIDKSATANSIELAEWFITHRKKLKKPIKTAKSIKSFIDKVRSCLKENYWLDDIKNLMEDKEWQSMELEWAQKSLKQFNGVSTNKTEFQSTTRLTDAQLQNLK